MPNAQILFKNFKAARNKANMYDFGLMAASQDLSWIANNSQGLIPAVLTYISPGVYTMADVNGSTLLPSVVAVYNNGVRQYGGLAYNISSNVLTFIPPYIPQPTDTLLVEVESLLGAPGVGSIGASYVIPTIAGVATPNLILGAAQYLTLTQATTLARPTNLASQSPFYLIITQDVTGGWPVTFDSHYHGMIDPTTMVLDPGTSFIFTMVPRLDGTALCVSTVGPTSL